MAGKCTWCKKNTKKTLVLKRFECERLLRCVLGPGRLVIKENISNVFKMCNPGKEVMYVATQNTQTGEEACHVIQHGEKSDVCLIEDKPLHDYMNIVDKGTYKTLPVFNSSFFVLETSRTHQSCYSELGSNQELVHSVIKLNSSANGTVPSVSESSLERCHQNLSVQLVSTSIVTILSGGQETPRKQPQQRRKKNGAKFRAEAAQCGVDGAVGGTGGGAGGDDGGDDWWRKKKVPDDKLGFLQTKKFHKKSRRLQACLEEARRILIACCCNYCNHSPQDNNRLWILLGASVCADEVVVCSRKDCPAKDFTHEDVRSIRFHVQEPLLRLRDIYMQDDISDDDLHVEALENAIEEVKKVFECAICYQTPIYSDVTLVMCENAHPMCLPCRERLTTALCPFCKDILPERTTTLWPRCLYEALNGRSMPDSTPSTIEDGMKQVRNPPEMMYIPPCEYEFGNSSEPEAQMYGDHAPRKVHPQILYSALDVDTLGEIHEAQDLLAEDPHDPSPLSTSPDDDVIGALDDQVVPSAPEEWWYQRFASYQQKHDVPLDVVDDHVVVPNDRTFQCQLENYQQTHNVPLGDYAQLGAEDRNAVAGQRRYEGFLQNAVGLGSNYLSHEEFADVAVAQIANQAAGASASAQDSQEEEGDDLEVDGVGDVDEDSDDEEQAQADGAGLGTFANEAAGGPSANVVQNTNDAVAKANQNVPVAKRRGEDDDDSGRDTGHSPAEHKLQDSTL